MDEKELKDLLLKRLYLELQLFKDSLLQKGKEDIYKASYKIEIYVNLYEVFMVHTDNLQEDAIRNLLHLNFGILEFIYQEWLKREDGFFEELRDYACGELETVSGVGSLNCGEGDEDGKEDKDGKEFNQAA